MTLPANSGPEESLNPSVRCGFSSNFRQIRPIVDGDRPLRLAIDVRDQWVASAGACSRVATITSSTLSSRIEGGRPGRFSSGSPSRRSRTNRARHRFTVPGVTPRSTATCLFDAPRAQASTIFDRMARLCADFARRAHRVSCSRSASVRTRSAFGRPVRSSSARPASRCLANRPRHLPAVTSVTPRSAATCRPAPPSAQASTIRARTVTASGTAPRDQRASSSRSALASTSSAAGRPRGDIQKLYQIRALISGAGH